MPTPKKNNYGSVTGARTHRRGGSKEDYLRGARVALDYMGGLEANNERRARMGHDLLSGGQKKAIDQALRYQKEFGLYDIDPDTDFSRGSTPTAFETGINDMMRAVESSVTGLDASGDTRLTPIQVEEILMSLPKKELKYGNGGTVKYRSGGMVYGDNGTQIPNSDPEKPSFFVAKGYDNRGDVPSGHEIAALFMRTPDGPKQINPIDLMEYFPDAKDVYEAYQQAGIPIQRNKTSDGKQGISFPQLGDDGTVEGRKVMTRHNRALMQEFGVDGMDALMDTLNIAPVQYNRERDLPAIVPGYDPRMDY
jgi:hypothetical protein